MYRKSEREAIRAEGEGDYHFCTDGLKGGLVFNTVAEYAFGMFMIGIICFKFGIDIYAFTLMPNHIHIVLHGTGTNCLLAFDYMKRKLSSRLVKDGYAPLPDDYWFKLKKIESQQQLKNEIIYVLRNPLEKGLGIVGGYLWSSGWVYYSDLSKAIETIPVSQLSKRSLRLLLGGEEDLPQEWRVNAYIGLMPDSFVNMAAVRNLFQGPKELQAAIVKDYEAFFQIANSLGELAEFGKGETEIIVNHVLQKRFGGRDLKLLSETEKGKLIIVLNREYGLNSYQISTSVFVKERIVRQLLQSKELR